MSQQETVHVLQDGLVHIQNAIPTSTQYELVQYIIEHEAHNLTPQSVKRMNILVSESLSKENCQTLHSLAQHWLQIAHNQSPSIVDSEDLNLIRLNWYPPSGKIGYHADTIPNMSTQDHLQYTRPVVSISLGNDATFLYKNQLEDEEQSIHLKSGDVVIFAGPSRMIFHSVPEIFSNPAQDTLLKTMGMFANGRFNITMRNEFIFKEGDTYLPLTGRTEQGKYLTAHAIKAGVNLDMAIGSAPMND